MGELLLLPALVLCSTDNQLFYAEIGERTERTGVAIISALRIIPKAKQVEYPTAECAARCEDHHRRNDKGTVSRLLMVV